MTVIETRQLTAGYGPVPVLRDVDLRVDAGELVALFGPNGAGKSTTLLTIAGELQPSAGEVRLFGQRATGPLHRRVRRGLGFLTEDRPVFRHLSAADNLRVGRVAVEDCLGLFPELQARLDTLAGDLSGGEQQMLTLARALARRPRALLADELSLGLAPLVVERLLRAIRAVADETGIGVLLVEQHVHGALEYVDRAYVLSRGCVVQEGAADEFRRDPAAIEAAYLGGVG